MGQTLFSFYLLLILAFCYFILTVARVKFFEPSKLMLLSWVPGIFLLFLSGIKYDQGFYLNTFVLISFCLVFYTFGSLLGNALSSRKSLRSIGPTSYKLSDVQPLTQTVAIPLIVMVMIYVVLVLFETITSSTSFLRVGFSGLGDLRAAHWEGAREGISGVGLINFIKSITRSGSILLIVSFVIQRGRKNQKVLLLVTLSAALAFALEGLSKGGRSTIGFLAIFLFLSILISYSHVTTSKARGITMKLLKSPFRPSYLIGGTLFAYFAFVFFPSMRNSKTQDNILRYLNFRHPSEFGDWVNALPKGNISSQIEMLIYGTGYFSHSITKLDYFINSTNIAEQYRMGFFNGKIFMRIASIFNGDIFKDWSKIRQDIAIELLSRKMNSNPWSPMIRDLVIDFGIMGTVVVMFFLGLIFQYLFRRFVVSRETHLIAFAIVICVAAGVSGNFGPFINNNIAYPLFLIIVLTFLNGIFKKVSR